MSVGGDKIGPFDRILDLLLHLDEIRPAPSLPRQLDDLFAELPDAGDRHEALEGMIWAHWCSHPDEAAARKMERVIGGLARQRYHPTERLLDGLLRADPDWAEAWNKRATLHFLLDRDLESVADIETTLRLEPRHFGALSGLGQICLRHHEPVTARIAFERALAVNPHLAGVRDVVGRLAQTAGPTVN